MKAPPRIPWLDGAPPAAVDAVEPAAGESAARRLLCQHLARGARHRREPAAFALALAQPEAAAAVREFLARSGAKQGRS